MLRTRKFFFPQIIKQYNRIALPNTHTQFTTIVQNVQLTTRQYQTPQQTPQTDETLKQTKPKKGYIEKLKQLWYKYGWLGISVWLGCYAGTFAILYICFSTGLVDYQRLVEVLHLHKLISMEKLASGAGTATIAFLIAEVTDYIRFPLIILALPYIAKLRDKLRGRKK